MRIALCDDNQDFLQNTVNLIRQWAAESGITAELFPFDNGDALLSRITGTHMDIVFLDVLMPLQNGIDIGRELRQHDNVVQIIYLTSSPEFALESYETKAQGYLLKPVSYEKLKETLDECSHTCTIQQKNMVLKTAQGYQRVYFHDIEFAEAQNKKVLFYLQTGQVVTTITPFHVVESQFLEEEDFFKCHRSYLVYLPNVDHFNASEIFMKSGQRVPIARGYSKAFKEAFFSLMFPE